MPCCASAGPDWGPDVAGRTEGRCPAVACIVLNWNGWADTVRCVRALGRLEYPSLTTIVVDNGSSDDSVRRIRGDCPTVELLETGRNLGFGPGMNFGVRHALTCGVDYVWLLNNDTEPSAGSLLALLAKAQSDASLGAVGSRLLYAHDPSRVQAWGGGRVNTWLGYSRHSIRAQPDAWFDYITAASMLLPRAALEDVGLFDESFFLYWEDTDLCFRLRARGWSLGVASQAVVLHKENASTQGRRELVDRYSTDTGIRFLIKHARIPALAVPLFIGSRLVNRLLRGRFRHARAVLSGVGDYRTGARQAAVRAMRSCDRSAP